MNDSIIHLMTDQLIHQDDSFLADSSLLLAKYVRWCFRQKYGDSPGWEQAHDYFVTGRVDGPLTPEQQRFIRELKREFHQSERQTVQGILRCAHLCRMGRIAGIENYLNAFYSPIPTLSG